MVTAGARAYKGGLGAEPPARVQGQSPRRRARGAEADEVFVCKAVIFNDL